MKTTFFLLSFIALNVSAQDVIVKKDGSTILSKVLEVSQNEIKYKRFSNIEGPTYTIDKSNLFSINYENGDMDSFVDDNPKTTSITCGRPQLLTPGICDNNADLIKMYNQDNRYNIKRTKRKARYTLNFLHVSEKSVLNNTEIELSFIYDSDNHDSGNIKITNVTNSTIYLDLANSFEIYKSGDYYAFYDNKIKQITSGNSNGVGVNLGSVAGVLGVGGMLGTLSSGIDVGNSSQESSTEITCQERIISIPPHASYTLTKSNYSALGLWVDALLCKGEVIEYSEENSPKKIDYFFTYSKDLRFESYGTIKATIFLAKQIGLEKHNFEKDITNLNEYTLWHYGLNKFALK